MIVKNVELVPISTRRVIGGRVYGRSLFYIVRINTDEGISGIGEMSDILHHYPLDVGWLKEGINRALVGKDPTNLNIMEGILRRFSFGDTREGIDVALHDLLGKARRIPVYNLLGGKVRDKIIIAFPLWAISKEEMIKVKIEEASRMMEEGIKAVRIYVGANIEVDKNLLKSLRETLGYDLVIRSLDLSRRLTPKKAIKFIKEVERYEFMYVESPCPGVKGLADVRKAVGTPISEHVGTLDDALKLIEERAVDIFNISISSGGFIVMKKLFTMAEAANVECVVGTTQELTIGTAAQTHIIASTPNIHYPCDPAGPLFYEKDVTKPCALIEKGELKVPEGIGLGVEIDENKLREISISPDNLKSIVRM